MAGAQQHPQRVHKVLLLLRVVLVEAEPVGGGVRVEGHKPFGLRLSALPSCRGLVLIPRSRPHATPRLGPEVDLLELLCVDIIVEPVEDGLEPAEALPRQHRAAVVVCAFWLHSVNRSPRDEQFALLDQRVLAKVKHLRPVPRAPVLLSVGIAEGLGGGRCAGFGSSGADVPEEGVAVLTLRPAETL